MWRVAHGVSWRVPWPGGRMPRSPAGGRGQAGAHTWLVPALLGLGMMQAEVAGPLHWELSPPGVQAEPDGLEASVVIRLRNPADVSVEIREIRSSCGCTIVQDPVIPWTLARARAEAWGSGWTCGASRANCTRH
jgi:hypothetical protein